MSPLRSEKKVLIPISVQANLQPNLWELKEVKIHKSVPITQANEGNIDDIRKCANDMSTNTDPSSVPVSHDSKSF